MARQIPVDTAFEDLSDDEKYYLNSRQWLKDAHAAAHQQYLDSPDEEGGSQSESDLTPEQWVAQASKADVMRELDERGVSYNRRDNKETLGALLLENSKS